MVFHDEHRARRQSDDADADADPSRDSEPRVR
jgi:hypothetical protein